MTERLGWYHITNDEYHAGPGVSKSFLWTLHNRSPLHAKTPKPDTAALEFGRIFHDACEDLDRFERTYVILPEDCRAGTGMKARKEAFMAQAEADGQQIIKQEDYDQIRGMVSAIQAHPDCQDLLDGDLEKEVSGYWKDPDTGLLCKCRIDLLNTSKGILVDYKSCTDARPGPFFSGAWNYGYHVQAGWYTWGTSMITGIPHNDFRFVAVEKDPPYGIMVHPVTQDLINYGRMEARAALDHYARCLDADTWPCYEDPSPGFDIPAWKKRQMEYN